MPKLSSRWGYFSFWLGLLVAVTGCLTPRQLDTLLQPPRLATATAQAQLAPVTRGTPSPIAATVPPLPARTPTIISLTPLETKQPALLVWVNQTSAEHRTAAEQIGAMFYEQTERDVEFIFVESADLPALLRTASLTKNLPDVVLHSLENSAELATSGLISAEYAQKVIAQLGADRFADLALNMVRINGQTPAVPVSGWQQLLLYRRDWFEQAKLSPPSSYEGILQAAKAFYNLNNEKLPDEAIRISGIVVPTEDDLPSTQRVFEHFAIANGCRLVNTQGEVQFLHPACLEAIDFYRDLINQFSPPDYQTEVTALKAYLSGRTAMILSSPAVFAYLAGDDPRFRPTCAECSADSRYLLENSAFVTEIQGLETYGLPANFTHGELLGIVAETDEPEMAQAFVQFWLTEGYGSWLQVDPLLKWPLYQVESAEQWDSLVGTLLSAERQAPLFQGLTETERWFTTPAQAHIASTVYDQLIIAPILQRMLSGYISSSQAIVDAHIAVIDSIPNYRFPTPTATPEEE